jgi:hypothetical protein
MILEAIHPAASPLQEVNLVPSEENLRAALSTDIKVLFSTPNRVILQSIFVQPFTDAVAPEALPNFDAQKPPLALRWNGTPGFKVISSYLTCLPAPGCRITQLRVSYELGVDTEERLRPVVCAMFPRSEKDSIKVNSSFEISSKLTIKVVEGDAKKGGSTEHEENKYRITTYGMAGPSPTWDFSETAVNPELQGDMQLVMVVAAPPGSKNTGELKLTARAELRGLSIGLITRRTENSALLRFEI